jgi:hypothetical protein
MQPDMDGVTSAVFQGKAAPTMQPCSIRSWELEMKLITPLVLVAAIAVLTACDKDKVPSSPKMDRPSSSGGVNIPPPQSPGEPPRPESMPRPQGGQGSGASQ